MQIHSMKLDSLDAPILIPEDLIFCNLRIGTKFIKEPHECIDFTDVERLIMSTEFYHSELLKESDFRRQNTQLIPLCPIGYFELSGLFYTTGEGFSVNFDAIGNLEDLSFYTSDEEGWSFNEQLSPFMSNFDDKFTIGLSGYFHAFYVKNKITGIKSSIYYTPIGWLDLI